MLTRLPNGLTVVVEAVPSAPVVAVQCWVSAGSADEREGEAGIAHAVEHMLFKGTARRGPGEIARAVEARGGEVNAFTSFDQTVYHLVLASRHLEEGLDVLADAVQRSAFDGEELARELEVIVEEVKRSEDSPGRRLSRALFGAAFAAHPYGRPVIGNVASVRSFTRGDLVRFHGEHYRARRMTVVVAGDVDPEAALAAVERHFQELPGRAVARPVRPVERARPARASVLVDDAKEAHVALAFPAVGLSHPDTPALDLLATVLGQGEAARLQLEVRRARRLAASVFAYAYTPLDPGLFVAGATLPSEKLEDAVRAIAEELSRLAEESATPDELAAAKAIVEADAVHQRETAQGVARRLGHHAVVAGDLDFERRYEERIAALTARELRDVAARWLSPERVVAAALVPRGSPQAKLAGEALLDWIRDGAAIVRGRRRARSPAALPGPARAGTARRGAAIPILSRTLPSGATVHVRPEPGVPLVALRAVWRGGLRAESRGENGISQLLARLATQGTRTRSASEVARAVDSMAGALTGQAGKNSIGLRSEVLSRHFERAFRLFAECLCEPAYPDAEVERERALQLEEIRTREDSPSAAVFDLFAAALFPTHPYGMSRLGTADALAALGREALVAHRERHYPLSRLTLSIVGDVDAERAFALAGELLRDGATEGAAERVPGPEVPLDGPRVVSRPLDKKQVQLVYGFPGVAVRDPARLPLEVLATVLAGQGGRLFTELRDRQGLAYSVTAFSLEGLDPGYFAVYLATSPEKVEAAIAGVRGELTRLLEQGISDAELSRAREYLAGAQAIGLQRASARAGALAFDAVYGLGPDAFLSYAERIAAVTREEVLAAARRILRLDRPVLAALGPVEPRRLAV